MVSGLRLEGRVCGMLMVILGGVLGVVFRVQTWILRPRSTSVRTLLSDGDTVLKHLSMCLTNRHIMDMECNMLGLGLGNFNS